MAVLMAADLPLLEKGLLSSLGLMFATVFSASFGVDLQL